MSSDKITFGAFVRSKRLEHNISLRKMAQLMDFSPTYWSDIENGRRNPPSMEKLQCICDQFALNDQEKDLLFDLAGDFVQVPPPDLTEYILNPTVRRALRTAKNHNVAPETWEKFEKSILENNPTQE